MESVRPAVTDASYLTLGKLLHLSKPSNISEKENIFI